MKNVLFAIGLLVSSSRAYLSEGWRPGQPATRYLTSTLSAPNAVPTIHGAPGGEPRKPWSWKDLSNIGLESFLTSNAVSSVLVRFGINVTEHLAAAREGIPLRFTDSIPLITDENYEEAILNEQFSSPEEERDRVWAIFVSIGSQDPISSYFDSTFDGAYNLTRDAADAPNVRWGRVDYLDVTEITTRWGIWKAPMLVIATERGDILRFFKPGSLRQMKTPEEMRSFIVNQGWATIAPWSGPWSPTGSRAGILAQYARFSAWAYRYISLAPRWLLLLITGTIASTLLQFLHTDKAPGPKAKKPTIVADRAEKAEAVQNKATPIAPTAKTPTAGASGGGTSPNKRRKAKK